MLVRDLMRRRSLRIHAALLGAAAAFVLLLPAVAGAQGMGSRTIGNSALRLDAGAVGDQLSISQSDSTRHKMELIRELEYLDVDRWQSSSVTWLHFHRNGDGEIVVTENGRGVVEGLRPTKKWQVEEVEGGGWKLISEKGGKIDLYLETQYKGDPYTVDVMMPKVDEEAYGAVYRGIDFLFFVVQKKHPEPAAAG